MYDVGTFEGGLFIAMELIQGPTLKRWIAEPHPYREVLAKVSARRVRGLAAAHAAGLVHRDFKPENVLLGDGGRVVVNHFGIARADGTPVSVSADTLSSYSGDDPDVTLPQQLAGALGEPITRAGAILGTPRLLRAGARGRGARGRAQRSVRLQRHPLPGSTGDPPSPGTRSTPTSPRPRGARVPRPPAPACRASSTRSSSRA